MSHPTSDEEISDAHSYFVPMVDMLAGVVFILVILLASVTLVSRSDFAATSEMSSEVQKIMAELEAARVLDQAVLEPRRNADAALKLLLSRLEARLERQGIASEADPARGSLLIAFPELFEPNSARVSAAGRRVSERLAVSLAAELPCLAPGSSKAGEACEAYPPAQLARTSVTVPSSQAPSSLRDNVKALELLSTLVEAEPALLSFRATDGEELLVYRGDAGGQTPPPLSQGERADAPSLDGAATSDRDDAGALPQGGIELIFQMDLPAVPPR